MKIDFEKLEPLLGKWSKYLKPFFEGEEGSKLYEILIEEGKKEQIVPLGKDMWKFLEYSDPDNLKVIIIGLDAYSGKYKNSKLFQATGLPLDCSNSPDGSLQPSLTQFFEGISQDIGEELPKFKSLKYLLEEGIFLGNYGVTYKLHKTGSMLKTWEPFWKFMFEEIFNNYFVSVPIVFLGKESLKLKKYTSFQTIFEIEHPAAAARQNLTWDTKGVFTKVQKIIESQNGTASRIEFNCEKTLPF